MRKYTLNFIFILSQKKRTLYLLVTQSCLSFQNHNLAPTYDFHTYMIRSMEEEFEKIVGVRLACLHACLSMNINCALLMIPYQLT